MYFDIILENRLFNSVSNFDDVPAFPCTFVFCKHTSLSNIELTSCAYSFFLRQVTVNQAYICRVFLCCNRYQQRR